MTASPRKGIRGVAAAMPAYEITPKGVAMLYTERTRNARNGRVPSAVMFEGNRFRVTRGAVVGYWIEIRLACRRGGDWSSVELYDDYSDALWRAKALDAVMAVAAAKEAGE